MELSVNLFNKGLQIDTHPMVLDNNTLSDCLNGTMITMSGNEVILQNDMGNRRIDNAFLPAGYQPLGMKEYGGVIYVAAYNPLTNRGLIGSFPSPQRKVNINKDKGGFLDFNSFINTDIDDDNRKFGYIGLEYIIIPLSDRIVLHTGDKFSIYSPQISEFLLYLLPDNIDKRKNNLFTFQVGVFNSLNEFVDITNKLKIWDNGYFINTESNIPNETIADNDLLKARNKLAINTYSQKMSSPLYLKAIINHISNLSVSIIEAEFINKTKAKLIIEVTYQYNCPDEIDGQTFKMLFNDKEAEIAKNENGEKEIGEAIYLEEFNEYSKKIKYEVTINNLTPQLISGETRYEYELKFPLLHNFEEWNYPIYVESLNKTGSIDLSKIGSDTIIFKGYRYFNNTSTKMTTLEVNLESYPKKGSEIYVEIEATAHDVISHGEESVKYIGKIEKPGVGTFTLTFPYETFGERELYLLSFTKKDENNSNIEESLDKYISVNPNKLKNHFFITTGIFNGNYIGKKFLSLEDRSSLYDENNYLKYYYDDLKDIYIEDFSIILKLYLSPILKYNISSDVEESVLDVTGNYIFPVNYLENEATYKINESWNIINTLNLSVTVNNPEVYPKEIDTSLDVGTGENQLKIIRVLERTLGGEKITETGNNSNKYYYGDEELFDKSNTSHTLISDDGHIINILNLGEILDKFNNLLKLKLKSIISVNNILKGSLVEKTIFCEHLITSYWDFVRRHYYSISSQIDDPSKANNSILLIKNPYFCFDFEGTDYLSMTYTNKLTDVTYLKNDKGEEPFVPVNGRRENGSYIEEIAKDSMNDKLNDKSKGNLFIIEMSTDDAICGFYPCLLDDKDRHSVSGYNGILRPSIIAPNRSFRRIWMKINKSDYIPLFVTINRDLSTGNLLGDSEKVIDYMYLDKGLHNLLQHIPHCFEYETGGKTLPEKVFNTTNYSRTKEFELDSVITINVLGKALLINSTNIFKLDSDLKISENITFKEGIIHSNLDFEEDLENIKNYRVSCAVMDGNYDNHTLYIKDCNGNYFDPLYIYYNDNECKPNTTEKSFKPSYIPEKFYVEELGQYMPELKSSRKLYAGKNGEHTLISEYAYPYAKLRNLLLSALIGLGKLPCPDCDEQKWDKTMIQCEGNYIASISLLSGMPIIFSDRANALVPLRTLNIFDKTYITKYCLVLLEDPNGNNPMPTWIDYDDYFNLLNS